MAYISLKDISYTYPEGFLAVDNISLDINKGDIVAIIGQNGAGKTTTVKLINALLKPGQGSVMVGNMDTGKYTTAQVSQKVGYVFQNPDDQIFHSTVYNEVAFGTKHLPLEEKRKKRLISYALNWTGLSDFRSENPYNLPLSIRKFVTIASIIAMDVDVMIFDEPTAGQDLAGTQRLERILKELQRREKTVITITHDMQFVVENFKKVIVMANKKVVTTGSPKEIFWDEKVMKEAMLKQPYISNLCKELKLGTQIVTLEEALDAITDKMKSPINQII